MTFVLTSFCIEQCFTNDFFRCGPCKLIEPVIERCAENWKEGIVVSRYDVESANNDVKVELLLQGVMPQSLPSLILVHKSKAITKRNGVITDEELEDFLREELEGLEKGKSPEEEIKDAILPEKRAGFINFAAEVDDYMLTDV